MSFRRNISRRQKNQDGYILLTLILFVAIMVILAAAVVPTVIHEVKRDREEELVHRGVQYSRAVRHFFKKFGRYPNSVAELENTQNLRFLRRRYKDPITGKDFRILHYGEVKLGFSQPIAGATPAGDLANGQNALPTNGPHPLQPQQPQKVDSPDRSDQPAGQNGQAGNQGNQNGGQGKAPADGGTDAEGSGAPGDTPPQQPGNGLGNGPLGGGAMIGVVSTSHNESIREFNHKNHYYQWQFVYDPSTDRGGLLNAPLQPPLQGTGNTAGSPPNQQPGQPANPAGPGNGGNPQNPTDQPQQ